MKSLLLCFFLASCFAKETYQPRLKYVAENIIPFNFSLGDVPFGGLSGMTKMSGDEYLAISDDRSEFAPARFYHIRVSLEDQKLTVLPHRITTLKVNGQPFAFNEIDPEAIAKLGRNYLVASEGSYRKGGRSAPFIKLFNEEGHHLSDVILSDKFIPESTGEITRGVYPNKGFESLTVSPSESVIFAATEEPLRQDVKKDDIEKYNLIRILKIPVEQNPTSKEYVVKLDYLHIDGAGGKVTAENGLSDMLAISDDELLLLERGWAKELKQQFVRVYYVKLDEKFEVSQVSNLPNKMETLPKTLWFDFAKSDLKPDNLEIITFGPKIDDKQTLILASDNNFSDRQKNQFFLFEILSK